MRASGILMHVTSLPGPNGIGAMGESARRFVDFLAQAGQRYWQILPLSPTGYGNSPYQSLSTFAGNQYLIDLETLVEEGLLRREEVDAVSWNQQEDRVDYGILYKNRRTVLYQAYERFLGMPNRAFHQFIQHQRDWLQDYALFMALKEEFQGKPWQEWPNDLRLRQPEAIAAYREKLKYPIAFHYFLQFQFFAQWGRLHNYAKAKGIRIIGDVPIYVPLDSADVWAHHTLFQLDEDRKPKLVAGVPPDAFTADGQLWGNPLYDWEKLKSTGYAWWLRRLTAAAQMYDVVRLDHFRGFESYWAVPAEDDTARNGHWMPGPGKDFIQALKENLPELEFIAEDLGYLTPEVRKLQKDSGYPGMKVLEFAFDSLGPSDDQPHRYSRDSVCYTGTHDNSPLALWRQEADPADIAFAKEYLGLNDEEGFNRGIIRGGMSSVAKLFVAQMQDYLELGAGHRTNEPGTQSGNWQWRMLSGELTPELAQRIRKLTRIYGRLA